MFRRLGVNLGWRHGFDIGIAWVRVQIGVKLMFEYCYVVLQPRPGEHPGWYVGESYKPMSDKVLRK